MSSIARNTLVLAVAKTFSVSIYFLFGLFIARLVTPESLGIYTLMSTLLAIGGFVSMFGVPVVAVRTIARDRAAAAATYVDGRAAMLAGGGLAAAGVLGYLLAEMALLGHFDPLRLGLGFLVCGILLFDAMGTVGEAVCQGHEEMQWPALVEIVSGVLRAGAALAALWLLQGRSEALKLYAVFALFLAGSVARGLILPWTARRRFLGGDLPRPSLRRALALLGQSVWLALFQVLRMLRNRMDILLLGLLVATASGMTATATGDTARALYGQAMRVVFTFHIFTQAFNTALFPRMARLTQDPAQRAAARDQYLRTVAFQAWWAAPLAAVTFLYADEIAGWFGPDYRYGIAGLLGTTGQVLRILALAVLLDSVSGPVGMLIVGIPGLDRKLPLLGSTMAAVSLSLNLLLIPRWGMLGAAAAALGSSTFELLAKAFVVRRLLAHPLAILGRALPYLGLALLMAAGLAATPLRGHPLLGGCIGAVAYAAASLALGLVDAALAQRLRERLRSLRRAGA